MEALQLKLLGHCLEDALSAKEFLDKIQEVTHWSEETELKNSWLRVIQNLLESKMLQAYSKGAGGEYSPLDQGAAEMLPKKFPPEKEAGPYFKATSLGSKYHASRFQYVEPDLVRNAPGMLDKYKTLSPSLCRELLEKIDSLYLSQKTGGSPEICISLKNISTQEIPAFLQDYLSQIGVPKEQKVHVFWTEHGFGLETTYGDFTENCFGFQIHRDWLWILDERLSWRIRFDFYEEFVGFVWLPCEGGRSETLLHPAETWFLHSSPEIKTLYQRLPENRIQPVLESIHKKFLDPQTAPSLEKEAGLETDPDEIKAVLKGLKAPLHSRVLAAWPRYDLVLEMKYEDFCDHFDSFWGRYGEEVWVCDEKLSWLVEFDKEDKLRFYESV